MLRIFLGVPPSFLDRVLDGVGLDLFRRGLEQVDVQLLGKAHQVDEDVSDLFLRTSEFLWRKRSSRFWA